MDRGGARGVARGSPGLGRRLIPDTRAAEERGVPRGPGLKGVHGRAPPSLFVQPPPFPSDSPFA